ncbi:PAS domain S-box-containing protein/diguanylate cyclase (GGDEF)-like protein [Pseudomonas duriflava]|uniref:PAS domain S-box-containing protein/diguanylate cyclase (GGDEF)-like protein n=1 Tax=Pseudomonas duriflava TaxID=459528 RepID=A0A562Q6R4_9PSED|nr:EAL domain-containing protein [Pseudomonas duriflava]TWI52404.1 PAS domain S-box-containing protein/diguanylate cyclase (GGDEF)-like protein [Pseudomonas duriflava]
MATAKKIIRLLIIEESQNEAERLVSLFRNAGSATRAQCLDSPEALTSALQQSWDLLIATPSCQALPPFEALKIARNQAGDLPFILLVDPEDPDAITRALMQGVQDAVPLGEDERLVLVAQRELGNLETRRAYRAAEAALTEAEKRCQLLLQNSEDAIAYVHDGMHVHVNPIYLELFGYADSEDVEGMPVIDLVATSDQQAFRDFLKQYSYDPEANGTARFTCLGLKADGTTFTADMSFSPAFYEDEPCIQVIIRDSGLNEAVLEEKLREATRLDPGTGLLNRAGMIAALESALEQVARQEHAASFAYLQIDHYAGTLAEAGLTHTDALLKTLARQLQQQVGQGVLLSRFSDDAFAVLADRQPVEQLEAILRSVLKQTTAHPLEINKRAFQPSYSIGLTTLDTKTPHANAVLDRAHRCAQTIARQGGNDLKRYDPAEELAAAASRGNLVAMVQQALDLNQFRLLFQPIISLRGDQQEHYEALLRLTNAQNEQVPTSDFLRAAHESGLSIRIDRWVIHNAIRILADHRARGHSTCLFLHLSAASLQDTRLLPWLQATMQASRLPAEALIFQISEADVVAHLNQARLMTHGLRKQGHRITLGQFGTSSSSYTLLEQIAVDFVKVDGAFVRDLNHAENQEALKALIASVHEHEKLCIVPFVESASILATLWQSGVNYIQGYYLQEPSQAMNYEFTSEE